MIHLPVYNLQYTIGKDHLQALFTGARIVPKLKLGRRSVRTGSECSLVSDRSKYSEIYLGSIIAGHFLKDSF
jgi:hypothetical protein